MGIIDRIRETLGIKAVVTGAQLFAPRQPIQSGFLTFPGWDYLEGAGAGSSQIERLAKRSVYSAWVYADISAIAHEASAATLLVKQAQPDNKDPIELPLHPFAKLWTQPNPFMGRAFMVQYWVWQLCLFGKAYLYAVPTEDGTAIAEIWPIPAYMVTPIADEKQFISGYMYRESPAQKPIYIDPKYIVYTRLPNPFDIRDGLSPIRSAAVAIDSDLAMSNWNKNFFSKENAAPTGIITVPRDTLDDDMQRVRQEIGEFFSGGGRRVGVARAGDLSWTAFDRSQKDMEFLSGREFARSEIDRIFGIPEGYWSKDATRANSEGAKSTMIEMAVWPKIVMLTEDLNSQLIPIFYASEDISIEFVDIRPRNRDLELREFASYSTVKTLNELRAMIGDPPLPDIRGVMLLSEIVKGAPIGNDQASASTPRVEMALVQGAIQPEDTTHGAIVPDDRISPPTQQPPAPPSQPPPDRGGAEPVEVQVPTPDNTGIVSEPPPTGFKAIVDELGQWERKAIKSVRSGQSAAVKFVAGAVPPVSQDYIRSRLRLAQSPRDVRRVFERAMHTTKATAELTPAETGLINDIKPILRGMRENVAEAIAKKKPVNTKDMTGALAAVLIPAMAAAMADAIAEQADELGYPDDPIADYEAALEWATEYVPTLIKDLDATTNSVIDKIAAAVAAGAAALTADQIDAMLEPVFGAVRADVIATTEITRALTQGALAFGAILVASGRKSKLIWRTEEDNLVCEICAPMDGEEVTEDNQPPAHPRCRCRVEVTA